MIAVPTNQRSHRATGRRGPVAGRLARSLIALAAAFLLAPGPASAEDSVSPLLWKAEQGASTVYLFGTFHLLTPDVRWLSAKVGAALDASDQLVLEISEEQSDPNLVAFIVRDKGMYDADGELRKVLGDNTYRDLVRQASEIGIPEQAIRRFRPWYAAVALSIQYAQSQGFDQQYGAEAVLTARAKAAGTPVAGLETAHDQLSTLADHPARIQVMMLVDTLKQLRDLPQLLSDMTEAWASGNEEAIVRLVLGSAREIPELYEAVIVRRNRNWIPLLKARLAQPGVHFVAVGVGHLVGEDSIVAMLRAEGISVEPQ